MEYALVFGPIRDRAGRPMVRQAAARFVHVVGDQKPFCDKGEIELRLSGEWPGQFDFEAEEAMR